MCFRSSAVLSVYLCRRLTNCVAEDTHTHTCPRTSLVDRCPPVKTFLYRIHMKKNTEEASPRPLSHEHPPLCHPTRDSFPPFAARLSNGVHRTVSKHRAPVECATSIYSPRPSHSRVPLHSPPNRRPVVLLITMPSSAGPMSAQDMATVHAEKTWDKATRQRLEKVYGDNRSAEGKVVLLTRPASKAWVCPLCKKWSVDIRGVCEHCLALEPSARPSSSKTADATQLLPGVSQDEGVHLVTTRTGRVYRYFCEPIVPPAPIDSERSGNTLGADDDVYDEEPTCDVGGGYRRGSSAEIDEGGDCKDTEHFPEEEASPPNGKLSARSAFTHFVCIPIGKLPDVRPSAEALMTEIGALQLRVKETQDGGVSGRKSGKRTTAAGGAAVAGEDKSSEANAQDRVETSRVTHLTTELASPAAKLHITLLLLTLRTPKDVDSAKELLGVFEQRWAMRKASLMPSSTGNNCRISLRGLHVMPDRRSQKICPTRASVVYMGLADDASTRLVQAVQNTVHECMDELIHDRVEAARCKERLHMTVLNKKWRKAAEKQPFDATAVLDKFFAASVGTGPHHADPIPLQFLELCRLGATDPATGTYFVDGTAKL